MSAPPLAFPYRCRWCGVTDFCHVDWARRVALCGACLAAALVAGTAGAIPPTPTDPGR